MDTPVVIAEQPLTEEGARQLRQEIRDANPLTIGEEGRLRRLRFATDPTCDGCHKPIETISDASLITGVIGFATHQLLIHNTCWMLTLQTMAVRAWGRAWEAA